jgi:nucleoside-diphosphate-sugar epimerase
MRKKKVLLTGATGNMGREALKQFSAQRDQFHLIVLALPSKQDQKFLAKYQNDDGITIVWGDLTNFEDVQKAVGLAEIVLHVGAFVSPAADKHPDLAWQINYGGTKNIVDAILGREDRDQVKLVYIGTVAQTGNRPPGIHWGRVGDPLVPSPFDYYALSKIAAERYVIESGLKYWVSLRQTGILHLDLLSVNDGIGYHQPLNNHLEWVTAHDSGRLLLKVCADEVVDDFWGQVYNIGGGESCRLTAYQFAQKIYGLMGVDFRDLEDPNWYALRNFHGQWYLDSDKLHDLLPFRSESVDQFLGQLKKKLPFSTRILKFLPRKWVKSKFMRPQATTPNSPLYWLEHKLEDKVKAFFGSRAKWEAIPGWEGFEPVVDPPHTVLDHGYDESKEDQDLDLQDMKQAAAFRGGECLSESMERGDLQTRLTWRSALGHEFAASPYLVLKAGHWCEEELRAPWTFDAVARTNPFIAQVWYSDHDPKESNVYEFFAG